MSTIAGLSGKKDMIIRRRDCILLLFVVRIGFICLAMLLMGTYHFSIPHLYHSVTTSCELLVMSNSNNRLPKVSC